MPNKESLAARYPDLLDEQDQPDLLPLIGDLDAIYSASEPPAHLTLAGALAQRERVAETRPQQRRWLPRFQPARRFPRRIGTVAAAMALAVVLLTAGSVFAYPLIRQVFDPNPGLTQVMQNPLLYQDVNASQTVDGFTLTVTKAYADANKVIIGYSVIDNSDPQTQVAYQPKLTAKESMTFHARIFGISQAGEVLFTSFDALSVLTGNPGQLHLHLEVDGWQPLPDPSVTPPPGQPTPKPAVALPQPLSVDFSVPFHPGRVVNLHQAVTVNGKTLILERVVVTPSETRAYLRGNGYPLALDSIPTLTVGSWNSSQLGSSQQHNEAVAVWPTDDQFPTNAMIAVNFETSLMDKHGAWTLVVPGLLNPPYDEQSAGLQGPWTFHFVVP